MDISNGQKLVLGVVLLAFVDIIWVTSSEFTEYIFKTEGYNKPFFSTYLKNALFTVYLLGFAFWAPWRDGCSTSSDLYVPLESLSDREATPASAESTQPGVSHSLSASQFAPVRFDDDKSSGAEESGSDLGGGGAFGGSRRPSRDSSSDEFTGDQRSREVPKRSVSFNRLLEVRRMPDREAGTARMARLSFTASQRLRWQLRQRQLRLPVSQVALLALQFALPFFLGQYCYQLALSYSEAAYVNILSSTSSLFTLLLAAVFPSNDGDSFTITKLIVTVVNVAGVTLVSVSDLRSEFQLPVGALWALAGAFFYAAYVVLFRARVNNQDAIDLPMFFGFVGVFVACLLWPGFFVGHLMGFERFQWPTRRQWVFLLANGLLGTVLSELLWIWGCLLTSSLIATLSLSVTVPLTMWADAVVRRVRYSPLMYAGSVPVLCASLVTALLAYWDNWDPVGSVVRSCTAACGRCCCCCRSRDGGVSDRLRFRSDSDEQYARLIGGDGVADDDDEATDQQNGVSRSRVDVL